MTMYTLLTRDGMVRARGLSRDEAAAEILGHDGALWDIVVEADSVGAYYWLGQTRRSINAPVTAPMPLCHGTKRLGLYADSASEAHDSLMDAVIKAAFDWGGDYAITDDQYDRELAEMATEVDSD